MGFAVAWSRECRDRRPEPHAGRRAGRAGARHRRARAAPVPADEPHPRPVARGRRARRSTRRSPRRTCCASTSDARGCRGGASRSASTRRARRNSPTSCAATASPRSTSSAAAPTRSPSCSRSRMREPSEVVDQGGFSALLASQGVETIRVTEVQLTVDRHLGAHPRRGRRGLPSLARDRPRSASARG